MVKVQKIHNPLDNYEKWKVMGLMMNYLTIAQGMSDRIIGMRKSLKENLESLGSPLSWEHVTNQVNAQ
jgi:aspartate/tyrosine/aromatic aminotransferase